MDYNFYQECCTLFYKHTALKLNLLEKQKTKKNKKQNKTKQNQKKQKKNEKKTKQINKKKEPEGKPKFALMK